MSVAFVRDETSVQDRVSPQEWELRCRLAAAHRLVAHFRRRHDLQPYLRETARRAAALPGEGRQCVHGAGDRVEPREVRHRRQSGDEVVLQGEPGRLQRARRAAGARPDINAIVHTHSPANLAVSAQRCGLLPITQQAMRFYNRLASYPNAVDDTTREGADHMAAALGDNWVMLLENHGALVCGLNVAEAYIYHHFFELACRAQIGALAGGVELIMPSHEACEERAKKFGRIGQYDH